MLPLEKLKSTGAQCQDDRDDQCYNCVAEAAQVPPESTAIIFAGSENKRRGLTFENCIEDRLTGLKVA